MGAVLDAGVQVIHVDVMDGHFVPPITIGSLIVGALRDLVHGRGALLDVHLMIERPERQVEAFAQAGADVITIHPESTPNIHYGLKLIRELGCNAGVVINPGTPVETVEPVAEIVDLCLLMSVNPGWGGQRYIPASTSRLARLRELLPPEVVLEVDPHVEHLAKLGRVEGEQALGDDEALRLDVVGRPERDRRDEVAVHHVDVDHARASASR